MPCEIRKANRSRMSSRIDNRFIQQGNAETNARNGEYSICNSESRDFSAPAWSDDPSTSSACERQELDERGQKLLLSVLSNDLIMKGVFSHIVNFQDRTNVEMTCRRFLSLSRRSPWKFSKLKNQLKLTYYALDTWITLEHGNLKLKRPSMTLVERRERQEPKNCQRPELLLALEGFAKRFGKEITTLTIGGTEETAQMYGIGCHQLIVTADLLRILLVNFCNIEQITFKDCGFDKDAVNFLNDYEGPIFPKLKHLKLISIWCDGDASPFMLMKIVQRSLRSLSVEFVKIERNIGEALMVTLEENEVKLETIDVTIANYYKVQSIDVQRYLRSLARATNKIVVRLVGNYDERSPALIAGFQAAVELENLTGITVAHFPMGRYENFDYDEAVRGLRNVNRLSALSLHGWEDPEILKSLTTSLTGAFLLESFSLRSLPETRDPSYVTLLDKLFSVLKVSHLDIANIRDMNSNHLRTLCKTIPNLVTLKLSRVARVSTHSVEQCLKKWRYLEVFDIEIALSSDGVDILCNPEYLPRLKRASFWMQADQQKKSSIEKLLKHFEHVDCWKGGIPDRFCRLFVRDRRPKPLNSVPDTEISYCHADHNPLYHQPLPPREDWVTRPCRVRSNNKGRSNASEYRKFT